MFSNYQHTHTQTRTQTHTLTHTHTHTHTSARKHTLTCIHYTYAYTGSTTIDLSLPINTPQLVLFIYILISLVGNRWKMIVFSFDRWDVPSMRLLTLFETADDLIVAVPHRSTCRHGNHAPQTVSYSPKKQQKRCGKTLIHPQAITSSYVCGKRSCHEQASCPAVHTCIHW